MDATKKEKNSTVLHDISFVTKQTPYLSQIYMTCRAQAKMQVHLPRGFLNPTTELRTETPPNRKVLLLLTVRVFCKQNSWNHCKM